MTAMLQSDRYIAARTFVEQTARPLDLALLRHGMGEVGADGVLSALAAYQNPDGGFGRGLEPDLSTPASSAIATSIGLRLAHRVGMDGDHPMVRGVLAWLAANLDREAGVWPIVPRAVEDAPHAPWWTWSPDLAGSWNGFRFNPTAELLAALYVWRPSVDPAVLAKVEAVMRRSIAQTPMIEGAYDLKCAVRLAECRQTPPDLRAALVPLVLRSVAEHDPLDEHFPAHELAPCPASLVAGVLGSRLNASLDLLIAGQDADGGWNFFWDWSFVDAAAFAKASRDWRGWLTREAIEVLHAHGRVAPP